MQLGLSGIGLTANHALNHTKLPTMVGSQEFAKGEGRSFPSLPISLFHIPPFPLPLEVGPLKLAMGLGISQSSPSGVRDGALAENEFGAP